MTPESRDWDKELAEIDKIIAKSPPPKAAPAGGPAPALPAGKGAEPVARPAAGPVGRKAAIATWTRVLLGAVLGAAMTQWPYAHACRTPLFLYLGASGVVVLAGLWSAVSSWRRRLAVAHTVSLLVTLWGLALVALVILPRIGYAAAAATWLCP